MTPLYNGSEYYKKMLDLQERLRKSEEERIRLEERFSLLEHDSRSRHETCINRLRMRYIDFLEEQQARDERNHQLLGALDRVDSSLALMSAKTDRLGALRKQYEASMLGSYENRRPNSSLTGDSGVASQNDERQRRCDAASLRVNNGNATFQHRVATIDRHQHQGRGIYRSSESPSQVRSGSSTPYAKVWSGTRCESSHQPSLAFSRFTQGGTSLLTPRSDEFSARLLDNGHANPRSCLAAKSSPIARQATTESLNHRNAIPPRVSSAWDLRNANVSSACPNAVRPLRQNRQSFLPSAISKYGGSVPMYSDDVSARFENSYGRSNESSPTSRLEPRRNSIFTSRGGRNENRSIASRSPKLSAILREELGDGEDQYGEEEEEEENDYIGGIVENQLERYISKIRSLHRDAEPRSIEEIDHEEANTSGDLLNVSLSDDALDLPIEDKQQPRDDLFPRELGNVLALAKDLADRTAASATNVANNISQDEPPVVIGPRRESRDTGPIGAPATAHRLQSIDAPHDQEHHSSHEQLESPAKNGISPDVAKSAAELASRSTGNIQDIAKLARSPRTEDEKIVSSRDSPNAAVPREDAKISGRATDKSSRGLARGDQRETDENLDDALEDLEPWNLSALERRVQEIILNDEAQNDFVGRGMRNVRHGSIKPSQFEDDVAEVGDESTMSGIGELQMAECVDENEESAGADAPRANGATRVHEKDTTDESRREPSKKNGDSWPEEHAGGLLTTTEEPTPQKDLAAYREQENIQDTDRPAANEADPGIEYGREQADHASRENESSAQGQYEDPNVRYEYNAEGPYEPNERYNLNENSGYDGYQGERYEYAEGHYDQAPDQLGPAQDPVDQQEYAQGSQEYVQDPSQMEYLQDPNQQYEADPINEQYGADPADQRYEAPINEQYAADPADQRYEAPINERYAADPADQRYEAPINERYAADPADQRYEAPINEQYAADPADQRYEAPINEQYAADPADQRYEAPINEQYCADLADQRYEAPINEQYAADPADQPYEAPINEQYGADPADQPYEAPINEQYGADPADQRYEAPINEQYSADPADQQYEAGPINEQYSADPADRQYEATPINEQYSADPADRQYEASPNEQYSTDPNQLYAADPEQSYSVDTNQRYALEGGRYPEPTCEQDPADFNERRNTDQLYAADEQYTENPDQGYLNDPSREYVDPNQQYPTEADYAQGNIQAYPSATAEYPYPAEYANSEVRGQEGANVGRKAEEHVQKSLEPVNAPKTKVSPKEDTKARKSKDVIKSILDSDTESTIERNMSNTESDFDFN